MLISVYRCISGAQVACLGAYAAGIDAWHFLEARHEDPFKVRLHCGLTQLLEEAPPLQVSLSWWLIACDGLRKMCLCSSSWSCSCASQLTPGLLCVACLVRRGFVSSGARRLVGMTSATMRVVRDSQVWPCSAGGARGVTHAHCLSYPIVELERDRSFCGLQLQIVDVKVGCAHAKATVHLV